MSKARGTRKSDDAGLLPGAVSGTNHDDPGSPDDIDYRARDRVMCPFTVQVDRREQKPFLFENVRANADQGNRLIYVPLNFESIPVGDYTIWSLPLIIIERKSKEDLYQSISQGRANFEARLRRMCLEYSVAAVVVEAEWSELLSDPPRHTQYPPKSLHRTIMAWMVRWPRVHWIMMPGRDAAESAAFRMLEKFWQNYHTGEVAEDIRVLAKGPRISGMEAVGPLAPGQPTPLCPTCGTDDTLYWLESKGVGLWQCTKCRGSFAGYGPPEGGPGSCPKCTKVDDVRYSPSGWLCRACGIGW